MKNRSIFLAFAASMLAATATASFLMPPIADAHVREGTQRRCEGYQRLSILLQSAANAERFSTVECVRTLREETFPDQKSSGAGAP